MAIWQDTDGKLHDDMNGEALLLPSWPQGATLLDEQQVQSLYAPTRDQVLLNITSMIQNALDRGARSWNYDSILSAASYVASTNAQYAADAAALIKWRDDVWSWATSLFATVSTETIPSDFLANMPTQPEQPQA